MAESGLSMEDRPEASRDALRAMRTEIVAAYRDLRPQPFGVWLLDRDEARERMPVPAASAQEQGQTVGQELAHHRGQGEFSQAEELAQAPEQGLGR